MRLFGLVFIMIFIMFFTCENTITEDPFLNIDTSLTVNLFEPYHYQSIQNTRYVNFKWSDIPDAESYELILVNLSNDSSTTFYSVSDTFCTKELECVATYNWCVRAIYRKGISGGNSDTFKFFIYGPDIPLLRYPYYPFFHTFPDSIRFEWQAVDNALEYEVVFLEFFGSREYYGAICSSSGSYTISLSYLFNNIAPNDIKYVNGYPYKTENNYHIEEFPPGSGLFFWGISKILNNEDCTNNQGEVCPLIILPEGLP